MDTQISLSYETRSHARFHDLCQLAHGSIAAGSAPWSVHRCGGWPMSRYPQMERRALDVLELMFLRTLGGKCPTEIGKLVRSQPGRRKRRSVWHDPSNMEQCQKCRVLIVSGASTTILCVIVDHFFSSNWSRKIAKIRKTSIDNHLLFSQSKSWQHHSTWSQDHLF